MSSSSEQVALARPAIGVDIEQVDRFRLPKGHPFLIRAFTAAELDYAYRRTDPAVHLCGMFSAKEAAAKTQPAVPLDMHAIQVSHRRDGEPVVTVDGNERAEYHVSISHTKEHAFAVVLRYAH